MEAQPEQAGSEPIRVLLVEDNDVFRQALILLLELQEPPEQWPCAAQQSFARPRRRQAVDAALEQPNPELLFHNEQAATHGRLGDV